MTGNRKPPELPNIEDATLRACLAPLMEAMHAGADPPAPRESGPEMRMAEGSNDNPPPREAERRSEPPATLAEWRSMADDDFGAFRMIGQFLAMTDADLTAMAAEFPKQIGGTVARLYRLKQRLAGQYDVATTVLSLLERAMTRVAAPPATHLDPNRPRG